MIRTIRKQETQLRQKPEANLGTNLTKNVRIIAVIFVVIECSAHILCRSFSAYAVMSSMMLVNASVHDICRWRVIVKHQDAAEPLGKFCYPGKYRFRQDALIADLWDFICAISECTASYRAITVITKLGSTDKLKLP